MNTTLISKPWTDYELVDSGGEEKLERFGPYVFSRPEPKALWKKTLPVSTWNKAQGKYFRNNEGGGLWKFNTKIPGEWTIHYKDLTFLIKPTGFKHMGIFPEQTTQWDWMRNLIKNSEKQINVLNLFAYTGGASVACLKEGANVTHVDSEKEILTWTKENARLSKVDNRPLRLIPEDAIKYVKREINRGVKYDAIILDPPKYGRGANGEVWKIETDLPKLLELCKSLLSKNPLFILLNAYAVSFSSITLHNLMKQTMGDRGTVESGELAIEPSQSKTLLPCSIFSRWSRQ